MRVDEEQSFNLGPSPYNFSLHTASAPPPGNHQVNVFKIKT